MRNLSPHDRSSISGGSSDDELDSVDHIAISVADIEASVSWYKSSFACRVVHRDPTSAMLEFANVKIALLLPSQQQPHIAFPKQDARTYGELRPQRDGSASTFVSDPTGNVVELIAPAFALEEADPAHAAKDAAPTDSWGRR